MREMLLLLCVLLLLCLGCGSGTDEPANVVFLPVVTRGQCDCTLSVLDNATIVIQLPGYHVWEPSTPVEYGGLWYIYFMVWPIGEDASWLTDAVIMYATSPDLEAWTVRGVALEPGDGWDGASVHTPQVVRWRGRYYLFYTGGPLPGGEPRQLGVAVADDPRGPWQRSLHNPVVRLGEPGAWDSDIAGDAMPVIFDGQIRLYYKGRDAQGNRAMGLATADDAAGPYAKYDDNPVFAWRYRLEAWNVFHTGDGWYLIADFSQLDTDIYKSWPDLLYFRSPDGVHWSESHCALASHRDYPQLSPPGDGCNPYQRMAGTATLVTGGRPAKLFASFGWAGRDCARTIAVLEFE